MRSRVRTNPTASSTRAKLGFNLEPFAALVPHEASARSKRRAGATPRGGSTAIPTWPSERALGRGSDAAACVNHAFASQLLV